MKCIYYNFKNLSRSERDMIMQVIYVIEELRSERNDIYAFLEAERKRDLSRNTERDRDAYITCLKTLEELLNREKRRRAVDYDEQNYFYSK